MFGEENKRRVLKRPGVGTGIGLSIVSLITGLALGLKRTGKDIRASATYRLSRPIELFKIPISVYAITLT